MVATLERPETCVHFLGEQPTTTIARLHVAKIGGHDLAKEYLALLVSLTSYNVHVGRWKLAFLVSDKGILGTILSYFSKEAEWCIWNRYFAPSVNVFKYEDHRAHLYFSVWRLASVWELREQASQIWKVKWLRVCVVSACVRRNRVKYRLFRIWHYKVMRHNFVLPTDLRQKSKATNLSTHLPSCAAVGNDCT